MRRLVGIAPVALTLGIATFALAASERHVTADFTPLAASGIAGKVALSEKVQGVIVQEQLKGLQPNTEYVSFFYQNNNCETDASQAVIEHFRANPAGMATVTTKLGANLSQIGSVSIALASDQTVQACASIPQ